MKTETPHRSCLWSTPNPRQAWADGLSATLIVCIGDEQRAYAVTPRLDGDTLVSWGLCTFHDGLVSEYVLAADCSGCNCPTMTYRPHIVCKHRAALKAALNRIGVVQ